MLIQESPKDPVLQEDLEILAAGDLPLSALNGATVLVTGATGLIGSQLVRALACYNRVHAAGMTVLAMARNREKATAVFGELLEREDVRLLIGDVTDPFSRYIDAATTVDYIVHTAAVTASKMMVTMPVDTIVTAIEGTRNILELAKAKQVQGVVYVSSMEVYGSFSAAGDSPLVTEDMLGYIPPLAVRSNYPESKRMCENLCIAYGVQYAVPVRIARLSQTFGAGILPGENRVFAQFARSAMRGEDIVLHTRGLSEGNYCYTRDTVAALLLLLVKGENGQAYNVSNEDTHTTIAEMAKMVAETIAEQDIRVVFDIPEENVFGYAADTRMKLSAAKLRALGWKPTVDLATAYRRMIRSMEYTGV